MYFNKLVNSDLTDNICEFNIHIKVFLSRSNWARFCTDEKDLINNQYHGTYKQTRV